MSAISVHDMENTDDSFPAADVEKELNPGNNTSVEVDSVSSKISEKQAVGKFLLSRPYSLCTHGDKSIEITHRQFNVKKCVKSFM